MNANRQWKVCVICKTYNHAPYIEEAMAGFTIQETNFPFLCIVMDDCSTDGEQEVIKKYLAEHFDLEDKSVVITEETDDFVMTFARHKNNSNCFFAAYFLKYNHYKKKNKALYIKEWKENATYIALCEGDDYWIHPKKLQMQVDFMETHPDYGLCHSDFNLENGGRRSHYVELYPDGEYFPGILTKDNVALGTATVLYRSSTYEKIPKEFLKQRFVVGDKCRWIEMAKEAKVKYLPVETASYRMLEESASHFKTFEEAVLYRNKLFEMREYYASFYGIQIENYKNHYTNLLRDCMKYGEKEFARKIFNEAKAHRSLTTRGFAFYLAARNPIVFNIIKLIKRY